jgi:hypothetical protein
MDPTGLWCLEASGTNCSPAESFATSVMLSDPALSFGDYLENAGGPQMLVGFGDAVVNSFLIPRDGAPGVNDRIREWLSPCSNEFVDKGSFRYWAGGTFALPVLAATGAAPRTMATSVLARSSRVVPPVGWNASTVLPSGSSVRTVGQSIWGTGLPSADRLAGLSAAELRALASLEDAQMLRAMYSDAASRLASNATAPARVALVDLIIDAYGG